MHLPLLRFAHLFPLLMTADSLNDCLDFGIHYTSPSPHFAQLKRLFAASEQRWGEQLFTAQHCLKRLTELEELIHRRFALLAQTGASDIHTFNARATRVEPVIYLLINGLGTGLSESNVLQQLETLCGRGPTVGIVPLLVHNTQEEAEPNTPDLRRKAQLAFWQAITPKAAGLDIQGQPKPLRVPDELWRLLRRFALQLGVSQQLSQAGADKLLAVCQQVQDDNGESDFLHVRIGQVGANPAWFNMGEKSDVYHALIGGATRTGKTTLLNNLILSACETCTPETLQLTLMDFKDGVSFWEYAGLAHVAELYAPAEEDFPSALLCLEQFAQQISDRYTLFRTAHVARLADYNRVAKPLPRCLLVIDEAQSLFEGRDYKQKGEVKQLLSTIAKKGAAAGVHAILSTQSFQNVELEGDVKDQFHLRIGLRHASAMGCRALMGRDNDAMLTLPRFTAIYNSHQGEPQHNLNVVLEALPDFQAKLVRLKARFPRAVRGAPSPGRKPANQSATATSAAKAEKRLDGDVSEPW